MYSIFKWNPNANMISHNRSSSDNGGVHAENVNTANERQQM